MVLNDTPLKEGSTQVKRQIWSLAFMALGAVASAQTPALDDLYIHVGYAGTPPGNSVPLTRLIDLNKDGKYDNAKEPYGFTGKEEDQAVGLHYFGARYYSSYLGRWLSPDPPVVHGGGFANYYGYGGNSPYIYVDPDGNSLTALIVGAIIGAVVGAVAGGIDVQEGKVSWDWAGAGVGAIIGLVGGAVTGGAAAAGAAIGGGVSAAGAVWGSAIGAGKRGVAAGLLYKLLHMGLTPKEAIKTLKDGMKSLQVLRKTTIRSGGESRPQIF
jgi:RHS repeat-associated protein